MGVTFTTYCKRCGVTAPEMGDFGYVGAPSLGPAKKRGARMPFGEIYEGFAALGMITEELAAFRAFLKEHRGHPIVQSGGGEDEDEEEGGSVRPPRFKAFRHEGKFVNAFWELACGKCDAAYRTASSERLAPFEPLAVDASAVRRFRATAASADDDDLYHVGGFPYDDVQGVDVFIGDHRGHPLQARIDRGPARKKPEAAGRAPQGWSAPDWKGEDHERYLGPVSEKTLLLLAGLNHRSAARRAEACRALRAAAEPGALGYLVQLADDPSDDVRAAAAEAIGALDDRRVARALGRFLLDGSAAVRGGAERAAAARNVSVDDAVRQARALKGPYPRGWSDPKVKAVPGEVEAALRDPVGDGAYAASAALKGKTRERWAVDLLYLAAVHPSDVVRSNAADGLKTVDDGRARAFLLALVGDRYPGAADTAVAALGEQKVRAAVPVFMEAFAEENRWRVEKVGEALAAVPDPATRDALVARLRSASGAVQRAALRALGALRDPSLTEAIASRLESPWESVREAAARALGATGGAEAVAALVAYATGGGEDDRLRAGWGLGAMLPDPAAASALARMLTDPSSSVRGSATYTLAQAQDDPAVHAILLASHRAGNADVVTSGWRVLIRAGEGEAALVRALNAESPEEMVRDYLSSGHPPLAAAVRKAYRGRKLPPAKSGARWGEKAE